MAAPGKARHGRFGAWKSISKLTGTNRFLSKGWLLLRTRARSIFQSFREGRGYSPMSFLKQVRLRHAREMLAKPVSNTLVTSVSFACGFGNLGRFANDYQKVFGETPSETLNRSKGLPSA
jgi:AraC-like DNA-binding protein